ncbi:hypothetical protein IE81DRAFT_179648 [Ceraceosorus guamensis]|uniref:Uncharacterized protein n=1 Tax=Ceraceosorus guamensis TaxID=1522189 RepID=A0A316VYA8_9BASI|nr:hypothetical protein IE81DRAFT_179648 [Ceraceosorus guamensis]PWN41281.1 hypothetical protein IE81DRAFT_179648 [Ceraceosorus guamensis]
MRFQPHNVKLHPNRPRFPHRNYVTCQIAPPNSHNLSIGGGGGEALWWMYSGSAAAAGSLTHHPCMSPVPGRTKGVRRNSIMFVLLHAPTCLESTRGRSVGRTGQPIFRHARTIGGRDAQSSGVALDCSAFRERASEQRVQARTHRESEEE